MKSFQFYLQAIFILCMLTMKVQNQPDGRPIVLDENADYPKRDIPNIEQINAAKISEYELRRLTFQASLIIGDPCNKCKMLQYFAFRLSDKYLTALGDPTFTTGSGYPPNDNQLWSAYQNIDGTWSFKSKTTNKYLRALPAGAGVAYSTLQTLATRWYIERHQSHIHIQTGNYFGYYWIYSGSDQKLYLSVGATMLIVQYWPDRKWLWNY